LAVLLPAAPISFEFLASRCWLILFSGLSSLLPLTEILTRVVYMDD
jgi:hypothetical protein